MKNYYEQGKTRKMIKIRKNEIFISYIKTENYIVILVI